LGGEGGVVRVMKRKRGEDREAKLAFENRWILRVDRRNLARK